MNRPAFRLSLAAVPVLMLAQCAPQCAPPVQVPPPIVSVTTTDVAATTVPPVETILPTSTVLATTSTVASTSTTPTPPPAPALSYSTIGESGGFAHQVSRDGRYLLLDSAEGSGRFDVMTGTLVEAPTSGLLTDDGAAVFFMRPAELPDESVVIRHDVISGIEDVHDTLPGYWFMRGQVLTGMSGDGRFVGVNGISPALADIGVFVLDTTFRVWSRPDQDLGVDEMDNNSANALPSADGTVIAFDYRLYVTRRYDVWATTPDGLKLVNKTVSGEMPAAGTSTAMDVSSDGRFVLFHSTSLDIEGGPGSVDGRYYVRDLLGETTVMLPVVPTVTSPLQASMSDDGQRVVFATHRSIVNTADPDGPPVVVAVAALYDATSTTTTYLNQDENTAFQLSWDAPPQISADGSTITMTTLGPEFWQIERIHITG